MPLQLARSLVSRSGRSFRTCPTTRLSAALSPLLPHHHQHLNASSPSSARFLSTTAPQHQQQRGTDLVLRRKLLERVREYQATRGKNVKRVLLDVDEEEDLAEDMSINKPKVREVLKGKYPAKAHARKVKEWIARNGGDAEGVVYLEGQKTKMNEVSFRFLVSFLLMAGFFLWLSWVERMDD